MLVDARDVFMSKMAKTVRDASKKHGPNEAQKRIAHLPINDRIKINLINKGA